MRTRRQVLSAFSTTAVCTAAGSLASCAVRAGSAPATGPRVGGLATPATRPYAPQPLPFDPAGLTGLSQELIRSHHDNNYAGAVRKLNAARAALRQTDAQTPGFVLRGLAHSELAFKHSVVLHELYFGHLGGDGQRDGATVQMLSESWGGAAAWEERFTSLGKSLGGGSGWAVLEYDLHENRPRMYVAGDHTQGLSAGVPLVVLDMYEHSYHMDFGTAAARYIEAFFANLDWEAIDARLARALQYVALR